MNGDLKCGIQGKTKVTALSLMHVFPLLEMISRHIKWTSEFEKGFNGVSFQKQGGKKPNYVTHWVLRN